ncbi:bifunctional ornithine acetyltransferase/N-acetylglutamate synthase [Bacillus marinisedimentorum]|uniref:bifunctional ornithine acetyltransferase/N-acetylglutamate synthase n=1 Tax=Bacillus marinisedimentorum TaxID=1821260 RepID=UPI0008732E0D
MTLTTERPIKVENGSITSPAGFTAAGIHAGLKYKRKDLGVIISEVPAESAAVYTKSHFQAAPLSVTRESLAADGKLQAVLVNSANANACTGKEGLENAYRMRKLCASHYSIPEHRVAVASTGVIGERLPIEKIEKNMKRLKPAAGNKNAKDFAEAILTTDLTTKEACYKVKVGSAEVTIAGAAKGSGMIHPNMGTMLAFMTTDAKIDPGALNSALRTATDKTYNRITVDGETSTNDMVVAMANGMAGNETLDETHPDWPNFMEGFKLVCQDLSKMIARDGEGATRLIEVNVHGAQTEEEAGVVAKKVVGSSLVKTAVYGADANWGRIIGAIGHADVLVDPELVDIYIGPYSVLEKSSPVPFSEAGVSEYLKNETVEISVNLNVGKAGAKAWGCDLTYDYVKINASYRT